MILPDKVKLLCLRVRIGLASGSLARGDLLLFKILLSIISFFRCASPKYGIVKKSTITDPFGGKYETLEESHIKRALSTMG